MFKHKEAEAVFSKYSPYLDQAAVTRLVEVDATAKNEWNPLEVYKGLEEYLGVSDKAACRMGLITLGAMYRPIIRRAVFSMAQNELMVTIGLVSFMASPTHDFSGAVIAGGYLLANQLGRSNLQAHEFLHAASYHTQESAELTARAKEAGVGFQPPTGVAWRDETSLRFRGRTFNEGITVRKSFELATDVLSRMSAAYQRMNFLVFPTYSGGLKLTELMLKKLGEEFGSETAEDLENKLYFQGKRSEFAEAVNDACRKNVFNQFIDLADQNKIHQAAQLIDLNIARI